MNRRIFFIATAILATSIAGAFAQTYTWTTIAGNATNAPGFVDGTNGAAQFYTPLGLTIDSTGNLYISDHITQLIRQIAPVGTNWVVTTMIGSPFNFGTANGTNSAGLVNDPYGLAVDSSNNIYLADNFNKDIRIIYAAGTNWVIGSVAGSQNSGESGTNDGVNFAARFVYPVGVTVDSSNNLYVTDTTNNTIRLVTPIGSNNWVVTTIAGLPGIADYEESVDGTNSDARFFFPSGLVCDGSNNVYIADTYNNTIRLMVHVGTNWIVTTIAGTPGFSSTGSADGTNSAAQFYNPTGVAADNAGNVFVADTNNNTIRKMTPAGTNWVVTTIAGTPLTTGSIDGTNALFNGPTGILVTSNGVLYVTDANNNTIRQGTPVALPFITAAPQPLTVTNGNPANFYVGAAGTPPLSYQWQNAGTNLTDGGIIAGSLTTNLSLSAVSAASAGAYSVIVNNPWGSVTSSVSLTVVGGVLDSVGDGIPDAWRAQYFGGSGMTTNSSSCATCDADHTGQNNKFKYIAGLDPTNTTSIFQLVVAAVTNLPAEHLLLFNPIVTGRTYTPQFATNLPAAVWSPLTSFTGPGTNGNQATVTDLDGTEPNKFYHIGISFP